MRDYGCFFFFKQKTAYEIGLGIPAEPLFRSIITSILCLIWLDLVASLPLIKERILVIILLLHFLSLMLGSVLVLMLPLLVWLTPDLRIKKSLRSEERRVGKECRSGWWADH